MLETIEINPRGTIDGSLIFLHGLGASGYDLISLSNRPPLGISTGLSLRFVFPHAPIRAISCMGKQKMRGWFDIVNFNDDFVDDEEGIKDSDIAIQNLIDNEISQGIPTEKLILAGFSQGGVMALHSGLKCKHKLGGIISLSAWLALKDQFLITSSESNKNIPIFMAHGSYDDIVPIAWSRESVSYLTALGYASQWMEYPMGHNICDRELMDLGKWIEFIIT